MPVLKDSNSRTQVNHRGIGAKPKICGSDPDKRKSGSWKFNLSSREGTQVRSEFNYNTSSIENNTDYDINEFEKYKRSLEVRLLPKDEIKNVTENVFDERNNEKSDMVYKESNVLNSKCCHLLQNFYNDVISDDNSSEKNLANHIQSMDRNYCLDKNNEKVNNDEKFLAIIDEKHSNSYEKSRSASVGETDIRKRLSSLKVQNSMRALKNDEKCDKKCPTMMKTGNGRMKSQIQTTRSKRFSEFTQIRKSSCLKSIDDILGDENELFIREKMKNDEKPIKNIETVKKCGKFEKNRAKNEVSIVDRSEFIIKSAEETSLGNSSSRVTNRKER